MDFFYKRNPQLLSFIFILLNTKNSRALPKNPQYTQARAHTRTHTTLLRCVVLCVLHVTVYRPSEMFDTTNVPTIGIWALTSHYHCHVKESADPSV